MQNKLRLTLNDVPFELTLVDNLTTQALQERLPLTLTLSDYNANEKVGSLKQNLPTAAKTVQQIRSGDVMLYGRDSLVIFYQSFPSGYPYTPIGRITGDLSALNNRRSFQVTMDVSDTI